MNMKRHTYLDPNYSGGSAGTGSSGSVGGIIDGGSEWSIYSYTGEKFERTVLNLGQRRPGDGYMFMDVNRDGLSDMLCFRGKKLRCHLNDNGNFFSGSAVFSTASMPSSKGVIYNNILGYNTISGLMTIDGHTITSYKFSDNRGANRLVAEMEDSYGVLQTNEYANLMDSDAIYDNDGSRSYSSADGFARVAFPLALLHKTTTYGNPDKTGHKVADSEYSYVLRTESPDGTVTTRTLAWGGSGTYTVTESSDVSPTTVTHYDGIGRKVHTENLRFDGQWQKTDCVYDSKGQLSRETMPYRGLEPAAWIYYSYDSYGRSTIVSTPDKTTRRIYSGNTVTEWRNGISKTVKYDALGNAAQVEDQGGSITYNLRNDGQPSSVTTRGVTTTFGYDSYGRRIRIDDPSAGTQTDTTAWNADGTSVRTQTNPDGQIVSYFDKFGRVTKTDRLGEYSTSYSYDSYGRLASEVSTNGTSKTYTYDRYDRVLTEKETVPDGKWLLKIYAYGAGSRVNSIRYTAQSGDVATENYLYSNGHGVGIVLSEGTVVMRLEEENDFGLPLRVTTGEVTREYGYSNSGMPVSRKIDDVMDVEYSFRLLSGNLDSRKDNTRNLSESFSYDALNRLVKMNDRTLTYSSAGNVTSVGGVGEITYGNSDRPYQVTSLTPEDDSLAPSREQTVSYTCYGRPSRLVEGGKSASFTYSSSGDRVKMLYAGGVSPELTRYYIGGRYEQDIRSGGASTERLYLGGDAYSAPMVLVREGTGNWTPLNIGRDYLGSVTHIVTADGTLVAEYSYDPWGRLRDPETHEIYAPGTEPTLCLGRGFTGHEHLPWFGLINMNARLYDPLLCRFLSPDPYVQTPDFTQSFNRYSYGLNNPLSYTDQSGEVAWWVVPTVLAGVFAVGNTVANAVAGNIRSDWQGVGDTFKYFAQGALVGYAIGWTWQLTPMIPYIGGFIHSSMTVYAGAQLTVGAANLIAGACRGWESFGNSWKMFLGNFYLDENNFEKGLWQGYSRHTLGLLQTFAGQAYSYYRTVVGQADRVDYFGGATFVSNEYAHNRQGVTLGDYVNIDLKNSGIDRNFKDYIKYDPMYMHEYGHTIDSSKWGLLYLFAIGIPSAISASKVSSGSNYQHQAYWTERRANRLAESYFSKFGVDWNNQAYGGKTIVTFYPL